MFHWTQAWSIIGNIPGPIGSLFAIAPTHILEWQFCRPFMRLGITDVLTRLALSGGTLTFYERFVLASSILL